VRRGEEGRRDALGGIYSPIGKGEEPGREHGENLGKKGWGAKKLDLHIAKRYRLKTLKKTRRA